MLAISDVTGAVRNVGWRREGGGVGGRTVIRIALIITDAPVHQEADVGAAIASGKWDNLGPIDSWDVNDLDPFQAVGTRMTQKLTGESCPTSSVCLSLPGLQERYPNKQQVADIWSANSIFPVRCAGAFFCAVLCCAVLCVCVFLPPTTVFPPHAPRSTHHTPQIFLVAPTDDVNKKYNLTAGLDDLTEFASMFAGGRALVAPIDIGSTNLQQIVVQALQTVTQTISLVQRIDSSKGPSPFMLYDYGTQGILSHPNNPAQATPGTILHYTVRLYWDGTPPCTATVTTFCVPQPHVIPFDAIFPIEGNRVRNGHCRGGARSAGHLRFLSRWRLATAVGRAVWPARSDAGAARRLAESVLLADLPVAD